jgi:hypothetical protein
VHVWRGLGAPPAPKAPIQPKEDSQAVSLAAEEERRRRQRLAGAGQGILRVFIIE